MLFICCSTILGCSGSLLGRGGREGGPGSGISSFLLDRRSFFSLFAAAAAAALV